LTEVAPVFSRHSAPSRFRGDRAGFIELFALLALALLILMVANDSVSGRVLAFFQDLLHSLP
jgi:hypothetical protein